MKFHDHCKNRCRVESSPDLAGSMEKVEAELKEVETEKDELETKKEEVARPLKTPVREFPPTELFAIPSVEPMSETISVADKFPQRRAGLLSKALDVLKKKKTPSSDTILSSVVGFYAAQATMLTGAIIG